MTRPSIRILVTGAGGFVGSWLLPALAARLPDAEVRSLGRHSQPGGVDIKDAEAVEEAVRTFDPTCVIHLAAVSSTTEAMLGARRAWDVNLTGTFNLADAVLRHAPAARFVFAGSSEIYGGSSRGEARMLDETAALAPRNVYAATKAAADLMLGQMAQAGLSSVRLRLFNHTGSGQSTHFVVPSFASQIIEIERGQRPPVLKVGNLDAMRDFLDVRDVVDAYVRTVTASDLPAGLVLNLASGRPRRVGDVLEALLAMSSATITVEQDEKLMRPTDVAVTAGDASRAGAVLGWHPTIPWPDTLQSVMDGCRNDAR